jgi:hypothetical protein
MSERHEAESSSNCRIRRGTGSWDRRIGNCRRCAGMNVKSSMSFLRTAAALWTVLVLGALGSVPVAAQAPTDLAGSWTLDHQASEFPSEVGFSASFIGAAGAVPAAGGGGRRGRNGGSGGGGGRVNAPRVQTESAEDAQRVRALTDEVRMPSEHLAIAVTPATVTIEADRSPVRTFQPGLRDEQVNLGRVTAAATATWDDGRLVTVYKVEAGRTLRYTYSSSQNPKQLIVEVEFVERGGGDKVRRVYRPASAADALVASSLPAPGAGPAPAAAAPQGTAPPAPLSGASPPAAQAIDQRPDAALRGLTRLGVVLESLSPDAAKCGLKQETVETAVSKQLTDAGFRVVRDSDDDTYLYVNINTVTASAGLCVSRYDVTLYSHTEAKLSYTALPVLLQVELLHKGGLAGGGPAAHADGVMKGLLEYVGQFTMRIRNAGSQ